MVDSLLNLNTTIEMGGFPLWLVLLMVIWVLPWKGVALWKAGRNSHKLWFVLLLVLNTMAILEIIYIFFCSKKKEKIS